MTPIQLQFLVAAPLFAEGLRWISRMEIVRTGLHGRKWGDTATEPSFMNRPELRLFSFSTCDLCDANKGRGADWLRVLPPVFQNFGATAPFCGPVETVQCFEDNTWVKAAVESCGWIESEQGRVGKVLVVDGAGSLRRALLGGNLGAAAARNGWAGVVVNGCVRDVAELAPLPVGIRALGAVPMPTEKRQQGLANQPVNIQGVWIRPGEWLYADADGMLVSPLPLI